MRAELEPHQRIAVDKLSNGKILCGGVGVGKSITAAAYYVENEAPKDVYVITTARKREDLDWENEFVKYGVAERATTMGHLHVDSWNNIGKYTAVHGAFFIFDEQRLVGSGAWVKAFLHIAKSNNWIMLSATPGDTWLDYIPVFLAHGWYKNRTAFKLEHVEYEPFAKFPKVRRYHKVQKLVRYRNQLLVYMPYERHTRRESYEIGVGYDPELFSKVVEKRWNPWEDRPVKNVAELFGAMRRVVNSDFSRLEVVRTLMEEHPKLIVFYSFDYELEILRSLAASDETGDTESTKSVTTRARERTSSISSESSPTTSGSGSRNSSFAIAEWNGHKHEPIPKSDRWVYLVQYRAGAEGWNCIETDAMVFWSLTYSYKDFHQAQGRIDRLNTPFKVLKYYILKSESMIDKGIWKALSHKEDFNMIGFAAENKLIA